MNFVKVFATPTLKNICERLLQEVLKALKDFIFLVKESTEFKKSELKKSDVVFVHY